MDDAQRILKLRSDTEAAAADVHRLEALHEAAQDRRQQAEARLRELGLDPAGDLAAQLGERRAMLDRDLAALRGDVARLREEAG